MKNNFQNRRIKKLCILNFRNSKSVCAVSIFTKQPFDFNQLGLKQKKPYSEFWARQ